MKIDRSKYIIEAKLPEPVPSTPELEAKLAKIEEDTDRDVEEILRANVLTAEDFSFYINTIG